MMINLGYENWWDGKQIPLLLDTDIYFWINNNEYELYNVFNLEDASDDFDIINRIIKQFGLVFCKSGYSSDKYCLYLSDELPQKFQLCNIK